MSPHNKTKKNKSDMPIGSIIPWSDFTTETNNYDAMLSAPIQGAGVSPTQYVRFTISTLVDYLNSLVAANASEVDVHMSVTNASGSNKLSVIFTAAGATEPQPLDTVAFNRGELFP